jgi:hypothetical protein
MATSTHTVVVVGSRPRGRLPAIGTLTARGHLLVVALGWPMTPVQRQITDDLQAATLAAGGTFEGALVANCRDAAALLHEGDVVHALLGRRDAFRLKKAGVSVSALDAP